MHGCEFFIRGFFYWGRDFIYREWLLKYEIESISVILESIMGELESV